MGASFEAYLFNSSTKITIFDGGHNENAIKIQLYSALIAYILIRLVQEEINNKYSILKITRIIRVYITKKVNLLSVFIL